MVYLGCLWWRGIALVSDVDDQDMPLYHSQYLKFPYVLLELEVNI